MNFAITVGLSITVVLIALTVSAVLTIGKLFSWLSEISDANDDNE